MSLAYIEKDQISAVADMIALNGELVSIGGIVHRAYVEKGASSQEASEFGIDDFNDEFELTIISTIPPKYKDPVEFRNRSGEVENIEPLGQQAYGITISLHE